ncbi:FAD-dependent oxidoreductase [Umezawaea sp. NPDC059074]|uniref:FAD-dependent oxidoreductase n=1 Tax=Umezawaea sp. NPDC059074 TaxID=3346716 RepID=UPI00368F82FE
MRALVIGAGLGGLTLAHGLLRAGVEVTVFERSGSAGAQPASYGLHLDANGLGAAHACLPAENWAILDRVAAPARDAVTFRDKDLHPLAVIDREKDAAVDPVTRRRGIKRDALRDALLHGLDDVILWDKKFVGYEKPPTGGVRVRFADGSSVEGDLLVAADGSNSAVRAQYLPDLKRVDLGIVNIAGTIRLTPGLRDRLPASLVDGSVNNVLPSGPGWVFTANWLAPGGNSAQDSLVWAWAGARDSYPKGVEDMDGEALRRIVLDRLHGWSPALRQVVVDTDSSTIVPITLRSMPQLPSWTPSQVTLIGDAIHNMTPMGGVGANTALRDADALRVALLGHVNGTRDLVTAVGDYETTMREYANEALAVSTRNARNATSPARLPRTAFRTMLRVAEALPPVKKAMFSPAAKAHSAKA